MKKRIKKLAENLKPKNFWQKLNRPAVLGGRKKNEPRFAKMAHDLRKDHPKEPGGKMPKIGR